MSAIVPTWLLGLGLIGGLVALSLAGLLATRPLLRPVAGSHNDLAGFIFAVVGVIYAVLLGLVAVSAWEEVRRVEHLQVQEAGAMADMHRWLGGLEPAFAHVQQARLAAYAAHVVAVEWPALQRRSPLPDVPPGLRALSHDLVHYAPATTREQTLYDHALDELNALLDARRARLVVAQRGIKPLMWAVLWLGLGLTVGFTYFFWAERLAVHMAMTAVTAAASGLLLFLVVAMDHPLRGHFGVEPDAIARVAADMKAAATRDTD